MHADKEWWVHSVLLLYIQLSNSFRGIFKNLFSQRNKKPCHLHRIPEQRVCRISINYIFVWIGM